MIAKPKAQNMAVYCDFENVALGVRDAKGGRVPNYGRASILLPAGAQGAAFMIFNNFHVIERYNTADAYVIGVGHLSDRIRGEGPLKSGWPRGDRNLRFSEKKEMQRRLNTEDPFKALREQVESLRQEIERLQPGDSPTDDDAGDLV